MWAGADERKNLLDLDSQRSRRMNLDREKECRRWCFICKMRRKVWKGTGACPGIGCWATLQTQKGSPNSVSTMRGSYGKGLLHLVPSFFTVNSRTKVSLWDVHVQFDCAGSRKVLGFALGSFCVAGTVLCRPRQKSGWDLGKRLFLTLWMFIFSLVRAFLWWTSNMCSRNPLGTLCVSDRSPCAADSLHEILEKRSYDFSAFF